MKFSLVPQYGFPNSFARAIFCSPDLQDRRNIVVQYRKYKYLALGQKSLRNETGCLSSSNHLRLSPLPKIAVCMMPVVSRTRIWYCLILQRCQLSTSLFDGRSGRRGTMTIRPSSSIFSAVVDIRRPLYGEKSSGGFISPNMLVIISWPCFHAKRCAAVMVSLCHSLPAIGHQTASLAGSGPWLAISKSALRKLVWSPLERAPAPVFLIPRPMVLVVKSFMKALLPTFKVLPFSSFSRCAWVTHSRSSKILAFISSINVMPCSDCIQSASFSVPVWS